MINSSYCNVTKNFYYSFLFVFPMFLVYELMCFIQFFDNSVEVRNGADVIIRQLFVGFGRYSESVYGFILTAIIFIIIYYNKNIIKGGNIKLSFLFYMLLESVFWSLWFIILMGTSKNLLFSILDEKIVPEKFYLAIGAGIWEELLFRVVVIGLVLKFLIKIIRYKSPFSAILAIVISAVLFSLFHYIGPFGEIFTYKSFYFRTLAGIFLGLLYLFRGFGVTVYTHIGYDFAIISLPTIAV